MECEWYSSWSNSCYEFEDPMYAILSSPVVEMEMIEWSSEEKKLFDKGLGEIDPASPAFLERLGLRVPWRSMDEIKKRYQAFLDDLNMIKVSPLHVHGSPTIAANPKHRRKPLPWTEEEHQLFLIGLKEYGRGSWRSISKYIVMSKTPAQVASHAQRYYRSISDDQTQSPRFSSIPDHTFNDPMINHPAPAAFLASSSNNGELIFDN